MNHDEGSLKSLKIFLVDTKVQGDAASFSDSSQNKTEVHITPCILWTFKEKQHGTLHIHIELSANFAYAPPFQIPQTRCANCPSHVDQMDQPLAAVYA
jgi:hypothetical protein